MSERGGGFPSLEGWFTETGEGRWDLCPLRIAKPECGDENGCGDDCRSQSKGGGGELVGELSAAGSAFCCLRRVGNMGETF